jgi:hypothetical protein
MTTINQIPTTTASIERLAASIIDSTQRIESGRGLYFQALILNTQAELGVAPRQRNAPAARLSEADTAAHLAAFETVAKRFLQCVVKVAKATVPVPDAAMLRQRTGFTRSAASTIRSYIRASNDITHVAAHKATKRSLAIPRRKRRYTVDAMRTQVATLGATLEQLARNLQAANRDIAHEAFGSLLARVAEAAGMMGPVARDPAKAIAEGRSFHTNTGVFVPIDLAAAREARKAAA